MDSLNCPLKYLHVSAWPAFDRQKCPACGKVYIKKLERDKEK